MFKNACALGCEGIVSKRLGSTYRSGRSASWVKFARRPRAPPQLASANNRDRFNAALPQHCLASAKAAIAPAAPPISLLGTKRT